MPTESNSRAPLTSEKRTIGAAIAATCFALPYVRLHMQRSFRYLFSMNRIPLLCLLAVSFTFAFACASKPHAKYREEQNKAQFSSSRELLEKPVVVLRAARAVLDELVAQSDPAVPRRLRGDEESVETGWVYGMAKDKYVEVPFNGTVRHKQLAMRRRYSYTVNPSISGSTVIFGVEEEVEKLDLKTGEREGWKSVDPNPAAYNEMFRRLRTQIREQ